MGTMSDDGDKLVNASGRGDLDTVRSLVDSGVDATTYGNLAVQLASGNGHLEVVKYLVSVGADVTAYDSITVMYAAAYNQLAVVKYLISVGADYKGLGKILGIKEFPRSKKQIMAALDMLMVSKE